MARWSETEFIERAGKIASDHVVTKKSLNDLSEKAARDESLQPDEIRTLVRLANVATFQELFKRKDDGDKMVEFESGDPEAVIRRIVDSAQEVPQSANVHNDKLASSWDVPDFTVVRRLGRAYDPPVLQKQAADDAVPERPLRRDLAVLALRKLANEFEIERISAGQRWENLTDKLAGVFKKAPGYGPSFYEFEKDAYAEWGLGVEPEMACLRQTLKLPQGGPPAQKIAALQQTRVTEDTPSLTLLKLAVFARKDYERFSDGLAWIRTHENRR